MKLTAISRSTGVHSGDDIARGSAGCSPGSAGVHARLCRMLRTGPLVELRRRCLRARPTDAGTGPRNLPPCPIRTRPQRGQADAAPEAGEPGRRLSALAGSRPGLTRPASFRCRTAGEGLIRARARHQPRAGGPAAIQPWISVALPVRNLQKCAPTTKQPAGGAAGLLRLRPVPLAIAGFAVLGSAPSRPPEYVDKVVAELVPGQYQAQVTDARALRRQRPRLVRSRSSAWCSRARPGVLHVTAVSQVFCVPYRYRFGSDRYLRVTPAHAAHGRRCLVVAVGSTLGNVTDYALAQRIGATIILWAICVGSAVTRPPVFLCGRLSFSEVWLGRARWPPLAAIIPDWAAPLVRALHANSSAVCGCVRDGGEDLLGAVPGVQRHRVQLPDLSVVPGLAAMAPGLTSACSSPPTSARTRCLPSWTSACPRSATRSRSKRHRPRRPAPHRRDRSIGAALTGRGAGQPISRPIRRLHASSPPRAVARRVATPTGDQRHILPG